MEKLFITEILNRQNRFREIYRFSLQKCTNVLLQPYSEGISFFQNVSIYLPNYTVLQLKR
jgi:hypothetical protein